jgi:hypothetical protein
VVLVTSGREEAGGWPLFPEQSSFPRHSAPGCAGTPRHGIANWVGIEGSPVVERTVFGHFIVASRSEKVGKARGSVRTFIGQELDVQQDRHRERIRGYRCPENKRAFNSI